MHVWVSHRVSLQSIVNVLKIGESVHERPVSPISNVKIENSKFTSCRSVHELKPQSKPQAQHPLSHEPRYLIKTQCCIRNIWSTQQNSTSSCHLSEPEAAFITWWSLGSQRRCHTSPRLCEDSQTRQCRRPSHPRHLPRHSTCDSRASPLRRLQPPSQW